MRQATIAVLLVLVAVPMPAAEPAAGAPSIAILPFDNVSGAEAAPATIASVLAPLITARGWHLAQDDLRPLLEAERVRYFDSIDPPVRQKIVEATGAEAILTGSIYTFSGGRNPVVALSARLVRRDGTLAWSDVAGLSADDAEGWFGVGRAVTPEALAVKAVAALAAGFPRAGEVSAPLRGPRKPLFRTGATAYRSPELDPSRPNVVAILPLTNRTRIPEAGRVVGDVVALRLAAAAGFETVEPAHLRSAAQAAGIASFRSASAADLRRLASRVGTALFLRGTIHSYVDITSRTAATPSVQLEMSLLDAESGKVLWVAQHERLGDDYAGLLLRGAASNAVSLADRVVSEMIDARPLAINRTAEAFIAARTARAVTRPKPETTSELRTSEKEEEVPE